MKRLTTLSLSLTALLLVARLAAAPASPEPAETRVRLLSEAIHARDTGDIAAARQTLETLLASNPNDAAAKELLASLDQPPPKAVSVSGGTPAAPDPTVTALVAKGRSQYLAGDPAAAQSTFREVAELDKDNADSAYFLERIKGDYDRVRARTGDKMLQEVADAWRRPVLSTGPAAGSPGGPGASPLLAKLDSIVLPSVNFSGMELDRVVNTLSVISEEFDRSGSGPRGVNIVLIDQANANPTVSMTLRNLTLKRVLDFVTDSVGYQYEVQADAVVVRPGGEQASLDTQFYPVSRSTVLRMSGKLATANNAAPAPSNTEGDGPAIRSFLQLAGVNFDGVPGSTLAFDGSQLIVTQSRRNLDRIRNILARYNEVRQVEIEAKFMEVQQGALEELGVQWYINSLPTASTQATYTSGNGIMRSLAQAFNNSASSQQITISGDGQPAGGLNIPSSAPSIPGGVLLAANAAPLANISGVVGNFEVNALVRALSQQSGTELLSAPKLTVLSGNPATITVAQELRYPQSYGQIQSQVGTGNLSGGGSAGVSITSGTPQEFTTRNVGVELKVTPTIEEDDHSVSLDLNPRVTEFEGFVEYGGPSVAISGGTTVTVPPGFYQPIFAVREVTTKVTIWDGATLVMGGLTREDVKKVHDKVPVLGSIPVIGRLFRSDGESTQKRNLLIFVTANLVNPGGALKNQASTALPAGSLYENPTLSTPAGTAPRQN